MSSEVPVLLYPLEHRLERISLLKTVSIVKEPGNSGDCKRVLRLATQSYRSEWGGCTVKNTTGAV